MPSAVLLLLLVAAAAADTNYCGIACPDDKTHTMCLYSTSGAASSCGEVQERGVSDADQQEILDEHNRIRRAVKAGEYANDNLPEAQSMPDLTWDTELATIAQRWADQCLPLHDCAHVPRFNVGQNRANSVGGSKSWTHKVDYWFSSELPLFTQQDLTFVKGRGVGHLTQVIWAATTMIGCGYIGVRDTTTFPGYDLTARTYICNYGVAGNVRDAQIYTAKED